MKILIVLLFACSFNAYAQLDLCSQCDSLSELNALGTDKKYLSRCFDRDSVNISQSVYEIRNKHKCKDVVSVYLYVRDTVPFRIYNIYNNKDTIFLIADKSAEFKGGMNAFNKYGKNLIYPREAERINIQGRVVVVFTILKTGKIVEAKVFKGLHPALDAEALRFIKNMPPWEPALYAGKSVSSKIAFPIRFTIH